MAFGGAMTMAGLLLASGAKGKRAVLPNTKMMLHMPSGVARGQVSGVHLPLTRERTKRESWWGAQSTAGPGHAR